MLHPATALEHAFAIVAFGLLAGQQGRAAARWLVAVVPPALALGAAAAGVAPALPHLATVDTASLVVLGLLIALALPLPLVPLVALGAGFGVTHGLANGLAMDDGAVSLLYVLGVASAGLIGVTLASAAVVALAEGWQRIAVRVLGSWIAAIGMMMLALPYASTAA
jgi:urease accessory protein